MELHEANDLMLELGHETGLEELPGDRVRISVVQRLEGVTGAMFEWWFGYIAFRPRALWLDWRRFYERRVGGVVAATLSLLDDEGRPHRAGDFIHLCIDGDGGCELRSSFWIDRRGGAFSDQHAHGLIRHASEEMQYLAAFVPELYSSERPRSPTVE